VVQLAYGDDDGVTERTARVSDLVRAQAGADLVILPELWPQGGFAYDRWEREAQSLDGPVVTAMSSAARDRGCLLHMGSIVERDAVGQLFNTSLLLGSDGQVLATYRKIHLFGFSDGEPKLMTAGHDLVVHEAFGLATCYDLRFPEMFRGLLDRGAEVLLLTSAWPAKRIEHWRVLVRARAIENQMYVVACNTAGEHAGVEMGGHAMVVDPWGRVLTEGGDGEEVLQADLDLDVLVAARKRFPVLDDRVL
jgi:predicted amidohydrolase